MVHLGFLFWLFLTGLVILVFQDLKRQELDNWLNLFLLFSGSSYVVFTAIFENTFNRLAVLGVMILTLFILMHIFYYSRVFAGGDAKLLFAMTPLFVGVTYLSSLFSLGIFILFLLFAGSLYGIVYSIFLFSRNKSAVLKLFKKEASYSSMKYFLFFGTFLILLGFFNSYFFIFAGIIICFPFVFLFARCLEQVCLVKFVSWENLQEGDWLIEDIVVGKKRIVANHDGLSKKDIALLKHHKRIKIKGGIPFAPAFLIGFLGYYFLRDWLIETFFGIFL